jgi:3-methyladenine DNA glycosylase/8-oxoguanine DNA glycosylase
VAQADLDSLRGAGLSRAKATYIKGLALLSLQGGVPSLEQCKCLTDGEIIAQLTAIKGVGRWTAEMFLIFNLGRPDVLPVHDLGVRRGFQRAFEKRQLPTPAHLERVGRRWAPYRTMAALYLWKTADFLKDDDW